MKKSYYVVCVEVKEDAKGVWSHFLGERMYLSNGEHSYSWTYNPMNESYQSEVLKFDTPDEAKKFISQPAV